MEKLEQDSYNPFKGKEKGKEEVVDVNALPVVDRCDPMKDNKGQSEAQLGEEKSTSEDKQSADNPEDQQAKGTWSLRKKVLVFGGIALAVAVVLGVTLGVVLALRPSVTTESPQLYGIPGTSEAISSTSWHFHKRNVVGEAVEFSGTAVQVVPKGSRLLAEGERSLQEDGEGEEGRYGYIAQTDLQAGVITKHFS